MNNERLDRFVLVGERGSDADAAARPRGVGHGRPAPPGGGRVGAGPRRGPPTASRVPAASGRPLRRPGIALLSFLFFFFK